MMLAIIPLNPEESILIIIIAADIFIAVTIYAAMVLFRKEKEDVLNKDSEITIKPDGSRKPI